MIEGNTNIKFTNDRFVGGTEWGPARIRHHSHHFATASRHSVGRAVWQAKMAFIEVWIPCRNAHDSIPTVKSTWQVLAHLTKPVLVVKTLMFFFVRHQMPKCKMTAFFFHK